MSPYKNIEDKIERDKQYYQENKESVKKREREKYHMNKKTIRKRRTELAHKHRQKNNERERIRYARLRQEILDAYGRECTCCGEKEVLFLELDHVNNDGKAHRIQLKSGGSKVLYRDLKKRGFPQQNFQLLCANCNQGKKRNGGICPHKKKGQ